MFRGFCYFRQHSSTSCSCSCCRSYSSSFLRVAYARVAHNTHKVYALPRHRHNYSRPSQAYHIYQAGRPPPFPSLSSCLSCFILSLNHNHLVSQVIKHVALANTLSRSCKGNYFGSGRRKGGSRLSSANFSGKFQQLVPIFSGNMHTSSK